jgi:methylmalonyl-CoA/ethylmalonyl-CoA epimerase
LVELVEPDSSSSPIDGILARGGGAYHVAFAVPDLDRAVAAAVAAGSMLVAPPMPAVAFGDRRVAFLFVPGQLLVEFVEFAE